MWRGSTSPTELCRGHREDIRRIRAVGSRLQRHCLVMADLPGPKIRIGKLLDEPLRLERKGMRSY